MAAIGYSVKLGVNFIPTPGGKIRADGGASATNRRDTSFPGDVRTKALLSMSCTVQDPPPLVPLAGSGSQNKAVGRGPKKVWMAPALRSGCFGMEPAKADVQEFLE